MRENTALRDKLALLEAMAGEGQGPHMGHRASHSFLVENSLLHKCDVLRPAIRPCSSEAKLQWQLVSWLLRRTMASQVFHSSEQEEIKTVILA